MSVVKNFFLVLIYFSENPKNCQKMTSKFQPGLILKNQEKWLHMADEIYRLGGFVPKVALDAFKAGTLDLSSKEFMNLQAKKVIFNKRIYKSWEHLKNTIIPNYASIQENLEEVEKEINILLDFECVKEVDAFSEENVISPIHFIKNLQADGSVKNRLVYHDKKNFMYWGLYFREIEIKIFVLFYFLFYWLANKN